MIVLRVVGFGVFWPMPDRRFRRWDAARNLNLVLSITGTPAE